MMLLGDHPESITLKENVERQCSYTIIPYASKVATSLLISSKKLVMNKLISECVRMACDNLLTTSFNCFKLSTYLLHVIVKICYPQLCCKLIQQIVISLQMTDCNKHDFNTLGAYR